MPDIADVSVIESGGEQKVVCVTFSDGKIMKAVLSSEDKFDLEQGISICLAKKFLDDKTLGNGSSVYNKIVRHGLKVFNRKNEAIEAERMASEEAENRRRKYIEKRKRKMERKRQAELEAEIELRAEAYLRAMRKYNEINSTKDGSN